MRGGITAGPIGSAAGPTAAEFPDAGVGGEPGLTIERLGDVVRFMRRNALMLDGRPGQVARRIFARYRALGLCRGCLVSVDPYSMYGRTLGICWLELRRGRIRRHAIRIPQPVSPTKPIRRRRRRI